MSDDSSRKERFYRVTSDPNAQFWVVNLLGWMGISLVTYLSLSLPYNQFEFSYLAHNFLQSVLGLFLSLPMRYIFRASWHWTTRARMIVVLASVLSLATLWAAGRLLLFMAMTDEQALWNDFGGWLFPSIFVFATWAALYHGVKYHQLLQREHETLLKLESQQRREALKRAQVESAARDAQLHLLRYQLNPHFLFNTLNAISALINTQRTDDARQMVLRLSNFLRYSLESDDQMTVPLEEEVKAASLYLDIERVRFSDRLAVEISIEPAALEIEVPSLLLQPLLENAIKYAIARSEQGGVIRIAAALGEGTLFLSVEDSGPDQSSYETDYPASTTGIGLRNTRARIDNLYADKGSVTVAESDLGGKAVTVQLPTMGVE